MINGCEQNERKTTFRWVSLFPSTQWPWVPSSQLLLLRKYCFLSRISSDSVRLLLIHSKGMWMLEGRCGGGGSTIGRQQQHYCSVASPLVILCFTAQESASNHGGDGGASGNRPVLNYFFSNQLTAPSSQRHTLARIRTTCGAGWRRGASSAGVRGKSTPVSTRTRLFDSGRHCKVVTKKKIWALGIAAI